MPLYQTTLLLFLILISCHNNEGQSTDSSLPETPAVQNPMEPFHSQDEITTLDNKLVFPALFEGSFLKNTQAKIDQTNIQFKKVFLDSIIIHSGKIIAADPVVLKDAKAFKHEFPKGKFPVELAISMADDHEMIAFVRILFSNQKIAKWDFAFLPEQEEIEITDSSYYGFPVDGGSAILIDAEAADIINKEWSKSQWENVFIQRFSKNYTSAWSKLSFPVGRNNVLLFSSGFGDGYYPTYIGRDKDQNICQLLIDFQLIPWWDILKPL